MNINDLLHKDFEKLIDDLRTEYNRIMEENIELRSRISEWNKDEEIQRARKSAEYFREHSLHELSDKEAQRVGEFRKAHYESCRNASTFVFELAGSGIGEAISIKCPICGVEENVTDYGSW